MSRCLGASLPGVWEPLVQVFESFLANCLRASLPGVWDPSVQVFGSLVSKCLGASWPGVWELPCHVLWSLLVSYLGASWPGVYESPVQVFDPPVQVFGSLLARCLEVSWQGVWEPPGQVFGSLLPVLTSCQHCPRLGGNTFDQDWSGQVTPRVARIEMEMDRSESRNFLLLFRKGIFLEKIYSQSIFVLYLPPNSYKRYGHQKQGKKVPRFCNVK